MYAYARRARVLIHDVLRRGRKDFDVARQVPSGRFIVFELTGRGAAAGVSSWTLICSRSEVFVGLRAVLGQGAPKAVEDFDGCGRSESFDPDNVGDIADEGAGHRG
jgi:hypothetical protein